MGRKKVAVKIESLKKALDIPDGGILTRVWVQDDPLTIWAEVEHESFEENPEGAETPIVHRGTDGLVRWSEATAAAREEDWEPLITIPQGSEVARFSALDDTLLVLPEEPFRGLALQSDQVYRLTVDRAGHVVRVAFVRIEGAVSGDRRVIVRVLGSH